MSRRGEPGPLRRPIDIGGRRFPPPALVVLAAIGGTFLVAIAATAWPGFGDSHAYWLAARRLLAGQPLYDPTVSPGAPFAYWYPPVVVQALAPVAALLPAPIFEALWIGVLLGCVWWLGGRSVLGGLALIAFPPVAVELAFRNVHLPLAVLVAVAIRRGPLAWVGAVALEVTPVIAPMALALGGRWRSGLLVAAAGSGLLAASVALAPDAWRDYVAHVLTMAPSAAPSIVPLPFAARFAIGIALALVAVRLRQPWRDPLLVIAVVTAQPTLWFIGFSTLAALVPLLLARESRAPAPGRP